MENYVVIGKISFFTENDMNEVQKRLENQGILTAKDMEYPKDLDYYLIKKDPMKQ